MSRTQEQVTTPAPGTAAGERPSPLATFGLSSLAGLVALGASWGLQRGGAGPAETSALGVALGAALGVAGRRRLRRSDASPPWWLHWDAVGFLAAAGLAGLATILAVETLLPAPGLFRTTRIVLPVVLGAGAAAAALGLAIARHQRLSPRAAGRRLMEVWSDPPADWSFFVLGVVLALPLAALVSPVVWDADSSRLLVDVSRARHEGLGFLVESQQVFLPMLLLPPVVAVAGVYGATVIPVVTIQALTGAVGYLTRKLTGGVLAPVAAMLALISIRTLTRQADVLPMYGLMLTLGYLAGWMTLRSTRAKGRGRLGLAILAGFLLAATAEAHDIGKLFFAVPLVLLVVEPTRRGVQAVALVYAALALFYLPRAVVNFAEGGFDRFLTNRDDWIIQEGHKALINIHFWEHPVTSKPAFFSHLLGAQWRGAGGWLVAIPAGLALVGLAAAPRRVRLFALACTGLMAAGLLQTTALPPHGRYLAPVLPGVAIAAGVGTWFLWSRWRSRLVAGGVILGLMLAAALSYVVVTREAHASQEGILALDLERITDRIDDGRAVTGVRTIRLMSADPELRLTTSKFFTEEEWVTYLTWPSDSEVLEVLERHDVGWVVVYAERRLEAQDEVWLRPAHGRRVRHPEMIQRSPSLCRVAESEGYSLYRVGCP